MQIITTNKSCFFTAVALTIARRVIALLMMASLGLIAGCVTTETGSVTDKADGAKALDYSLQLAQNYLREGNVEAAKRHLKKALEMDDSSAEVHGTLAVLFQSTGELELAEQHFKKSLSLQRNSAKVRNNYAVFLYQQQRYEDAVSQMEKVVEDTLYEKRANAFVNLGRGYLKLGQLEKAQQSFRRGYLLNRNNLQTIYQLAEVNFKLANYPESQQYYDRYRRDVKRQPPQALWLGIQLAQKFDDQNALASYTLALKNLYPTSKEYLQYKRVFGHD